MGEYLRDVQKEEVQILYDLLLGGVHLTFYQLSYILVEVNMPICKKCGTRFPDRIEISGQIKLLRSRKYCLSCSPYKQHNTKQIHKNSTVCGDLVVCKICKKEFIYDRSKGHGLSICNGCKIRTRRRKLKVRMVERKGGSCQKCGYNRSFRALHFHHLESAEKDANISTLYHKSWDFIIKELNKCILVCSNCHTEIHEKLDNER